MEETVEVQDSWAPGLHEVLVGLGEGDFVIVDDTLIPTDCIGADETPYSQKHKRHGVTVQVTARRSEHRSGFSRATPGRTNDLNAAGANDTVQACQTRQILILADRAYQAVGATVRTPNYGRRGLSEHDQQYNRDHARPRAPGERAFAQLKSCRLLRGARSSTNRLSRIIRVVHTLLICTNIG